jgi:hypothetical protein
MRTLDEDALDKWKENTLRTIKAIEGVSTALLLRASFTHSTGPIYA